MNWVILGRRHINVEHIDSFYWEKGILNICFLGIDVQYEFQDPDGRQYKIVCNACCMNAVGLEAEP